MKQEYPQQQFVLLPRVKRRVHHVKRRLQDRRCQRGVAAVRHLAVALAVAAVQCFSDRCRSPCDNVQLKRNFNNQ